MSSSRVPGKHHAGGAGSGSSSSSLVSGLVKRLNQVERELQAAQARSRQQQDEVALLKTQLAAARQQPPQAQGGGGAAIAQLKHQQRRRRQWGAARAEGAPDEAAAAAASEEAERWRRQAKRAWAVVGKMKEFLQDYGLVWVGDEDADADADADAGAPGPPGAPEAGGARRRDAGPGAAFRVDMPRLRRKIEYLNRMTAEDAGAAEAASSATEAIDRYCDALSRPEAEVLTLRVFRDGVQLGKFPGERHAAAAAASRASRPEFHSFDSKQARRMLQDIADGYFPSQLRYRYPHGVRLELEDRHQEPFAADGADAGERDAHGKENLAAEHARGKEGGRADAHAGGGAEQQQHQQHQQQHQHQQRAKEPLSNVHGLSSLAGGGSGADAGGPSSSSSSSAAPMSKSSFLQRLPAAIIRNGKVIEVRSDVANMLGGRPGHAPGEAPGGDGPIALTETIVGGLMRRPAAGRREAPAARGAGEAAGWSSEEEGDGDDGGLELEEEEDGEEGEGARVEVATIQVKTEDRLQTYVLKLAQTSTVGKIYRMIDRHRGGGPRTYELRGGFPPRAYADTDATLLDAGLVPNASLFMRELPAA